MAVFAPVNRLSVVRFALLWSAVVPMSVSLAAEKTGKVVPHIIVLRNGRVLAGQVTLIEAGYQVDSLSGRVVIPRPLVEVEALNLVDAHRKLRSKIPEESASSHVALGRWCLAHGLNQQALAEFRVAERLTPKNKKSATKEVIAQLAPKVAPRGTAPTVRSVTAVMSRDVEPIEALGGLPRDVAGHFVQRIQPLLSNRCGNGSCHGTSVRRAFQLEPIGRNRSGFQVRTRKNLESVLGQVDLSRPVDSPLLRFARKSHGSIPGIRSVRPLGPEQVALIESWVRRVARSSKRRVETPAQGEASPETTATVSKGRAKPSEVDVFDPEVFNRETRRLKAARKTAATAMRRRRIRKAGGG